MSVFVLQADLSFVPPFLVICFVTLFVVTVDFDFFLYLLFLVICFVTLFVVTVDLDFFLVFFSIGHHFCLDRLDEPEGAAG